MIDKKSHMYAGKFYLLLDGEVLDPENLPVQSYDGGSIKDARVVPPQPKMQQASTAQNTSDNDDDDEGGRIDNIESAFADALEDYEAEEDNMSTIGTVAWIKTELAALEVPYEPNTKHNELKQLFVKAINDSNAS